MDLKAMGFTDAYVKLIIEYMEEEDIASFLANADKRLTKKARILSAIYLKRVGFYPNRKDETPAIFDFIISEELTDNLLVVAIAKDKQMQWITVENSTVDNGR